MATTTENEAMVSITWKGATTEKGLDELGITADMGDVEILGRVANGLDREVGEMVGYTVQREANGNVTIRPSAEFGK